jgi:hypothetical protein
MYFGTCQTAVDVKKEFNRLALSLHPDKGGSKETFVALLDEYEAAKQRVAGGVEKPTRWWAGLQRNDLWDHIKAVRARNKDAIDAVNRESLELEKAMEDGKEYTHKERVMLYTDYDAQGQVGALLGSRKKNPIGTF